ncbi:MAG: LptF/LptG family permease [Enterobacterales bacterium]|nr:LptF/LptG family permease [Enterobacterales bacterium]
MKKDLAKMLMPMALVLALFAGGLSTMLTPWAMSHSEVIMREEAAKAKLGIFTAGQFRENSHKDGVVYVEAKSDSGEIKGVFSVSRPKDLTLNNGQSESNLENRQSESRSETRQSNGVEGLNQASQNQEVTTSLVNPASNVTTETSYSSLKIQTAARGRQWEDETNGINYLVLEQGQFSEYNIKDGRWQVTDFDSSYTKIEQNQMFNANKEQLPTSTIELLKVLGHREWAELHWRIAAPISIPLLCLLAVPLSRSRPRQGKFARILPSMMIYLGYVLLMLYTRKMIALGQLPGSVGFWWIHLALGAFIYWLYKPKKLAPKKTNQVRPANV